MKESETNIVSTEPKIVTPVASDARKKVNSMNEHTFNCSCTVPAGLSVKQNWCHIHSRYLVKTDRLREKKCLCFQPINAQILFRIIVALNFYCLLRFIAELTVTLSDRFYFSFKTFRLQLNKFLLIYVLDERAKPLLGLVTFVDWNRQINSLSPSEYVQLFARIQSIVAHRNKSLLQRWVFQQNVGQWDLI